MLRFVRLKKKNSKNLTFEFYLSMLKHASMQSIVETICINNLWYGGVNGVKQEIKDFNLLFLLLFLLESFVKCFLL